jgi:type IV fimbrial biogenesis protein FimT
MKRFANEIKTIPGRGPAGFTVIELMIVVAIAATIIAIAGPTTLTWLRQRGVRDAAEQLEFDLQRAKLLAIQRNANCSVTINLPAANQYTISLINEIVDLGSYSGNVTFTDAPDPSTAVVTFTPQGICQAFGAIYLTDQNSRYRIRATAAGAVSTHLFSAGQWL